VGLKSGGVFAAAHSTFIDQSTTNPEHRPLVEWHVSKSLWEARAMTTGAASKRGWRDFINKDVLREYADPLGALVAAAVFAVLAGLGIVKDELLAGVTLAVLAAVAGVMLRQRYLLEEAKMSFDAVPGRLDEVREALGESDRSTRTALERVERMVDAIGSNDPYDILEHHTEWDIVASDGSLAYGRKFKRLRFNQHNVVSIYEVSSTSASGTISDWTFEPTSIEQVGVVDVEGEAHFLLSLGARYQRNEELEYRSTRTIRDLFVDPKNWVSHEVRDETHRLRLKVQWPPDTPPKHVRIEEIRPDGQTKRDEIAGGSLSVDGGRPVLEREYHQPPRGLKIVVTWWL
jgi:hypothetical protein